MSDGTETEAVELGDERQKHITILTTVGEQITYRNSYLRHSTTEFIISSSESFHSNETSRYSKTEIDRIEIDQHHSRCFITTAVANEGTALQVLRDFRDNALTTSPLGRFLLVVYETVSPPIAETFTHYPDTRTTLVVRWLVLQCAQIANRRATTSSALGRLGLSALLVILYTVGVIIALFGHLIIQFQAWRANHSFRGQPPRRSRRRSPRTRP
jgi:hypothetical protein